MKPASCFEMLLHFSMRFVDFSLLISFRSVPTISMDRTSPHEPFLFSGLKNMFIF